MEYIDFKKLVDALTSKPKFVGGESCLLHARC